MRFNVKWVQNKQLKVRFNNHLGFCFLVCFVFAFVCFLFLFSFLFVCLFCFVLFLMKQMQNVFAVSLKY